MMHLSEQFAGGMRSRSRLRGRGSQGGAFVGTLVAFFFADPLDLFGSAQKKRPELHCPRLLYTPKCDGARVSDV